MRRRRGRKNPLSSGPPPQYAFGGMGTPQTWTYRGREITLDEREHAWYASWPEPTDDGELDSIYGTGPHEALGNARLAIDLAELGGDWPAVARAIERVGDQISGKFDRKVLARAVEVAFQRKLAGEDVPHVPKAGAKAYFELPVPDRIRLLDEMIARYKRAGLLENPASAEDLGARAAVSVRTGTGDPAFDDMVAETLTLQQILQLQNGDDSPALRRAAGRRLAGRLHPRRPIRGRKRPDNPARTECLAW